MAARARVPHRGSLCAACADAEHRHRQAAAPSAACRGQRAARRVDSELARRDAQARRPRPVPPPRCQALASRPNALTQRHRAQAAGKHQAGKGAPPDPQRFQPSTSRALDGNAFQAITATSFSAVATPPICRLGALRASVRTGDRHADQPQSSMSGTPDRCETASTRRARAGGEPDVVRRREPWGRDAGRAQCRAASARATTASAQAASRKLDPQARRRIVPRGRSNRARDVDAAVAGYRPRTTEATLAESPDGPPRRSFRAAPSPTRPTGGSAEQQTAAPE